MTKSAEKKVLNEFLQLYKEKSCLWDTRNAFYNNRNIRDEAYLILLEKYQLIDEHATLKDVKQRLENMRSAYRRENKKVMSYKIQGYEYKPALWYYDLLDFINQDELLELESVSLECNDNQYVVKEEEEEVIQNPIRSGIKRPKLTPKSPEQSSQSASYDSLNDSSVRNDNLALSDSEAVVFGKTVGLQLQDLIPSQRFIAEKLISEVIFYGRMEKLTPDCSLSAIKDFSDD